MVIKNFFSSNLVGRKFFSQQCSNFFLLHLCCMQFFSSNKRLQEIFFQNHLPPPSRVKWSAPKLGKVWLKIISTKKQLKTFYVKAIVVNSLTTELKKSCFLPSIIVSNRKNDNNPKERKPAKCFY